MSLRRIFFPQRIPEPKEMEEVEMKVFEKFSLENYKRWFVPLVDHILKKANLKKGLIADIACGPGLLTREIAYRSKEFDIIGIDNSLGAFKLFKKNCGRLQNVKFKLCNVYHLPFQDNLFDLVVCKDSLHHFDNLKKALHEMYRTLKPDGLLYLQDLRRDLPQYILQRSTPPDTVLKRLQFYSTRAAYTKEEIKEIFRTMHFKNYYVRTRNVTNLLKGRYKSQDIDIKELKISFQARYIAILKKT